MRSPHRVLRLTSRFIGSQVREHFDIPIIFHNLAQSRDTRASASSRSLWTTLSLKERVVGRNRP